MEDYETFFNKFLRHLEASPVTQEPSREPSSYRSNVLEIYA